jgi:hypothetical protein
MNWERHHIEVVTAATAGHVTRASDLLREHLARYRPRQRPGDRGTSRMAAWAEGQDRRRRGTLLDPQRRAKAALAVRSVDVVRNLHAASGPRPRAPWH